MNTDMFENAETHYEYLKAQYELEQQKAAKLKEEICFACRVIWGIKDCNTCSHGIKR